MTTIRDIRLRNARSLAPDGPAKFADDMGMMRQQASSIIGKTPRKAIGDKLARRIEEVFGKPEGWLDRDHGDAAEAPAPGEYIDAPRIGEAGGDDILMRALLRRDRLPAGTDTRSWRIATAPSDAMFSTAPQGSTLYIEVGANIAEGIYYLVIDGHEDCRLVRPLKGDSVQLIAENGAIPPVIKPRSELDAIGRVHIVQPPPVKV